MKILVVDDIRTNRKLLRAMLEADGRVVHEAADGLQALEMLERVEVDVIVSDILMPRMDGYRLCQAVRHHRSLFDLPFVFYTSTYTSQDDASFAAMIGGDRFLAKPVSADVMLATLEEVCAPREAPRGSGGQPPLEVDLLRQYNDRLVYKLEHKNLELVRSRERLQALIENIDGVVWEGDPDTMELTFISAQIERLLLFPVERWLADPLFWQSRVHPDDLRQVQRSAAQWRGRPALHHEIRMIDARGQVVWVHTSGSLCGDPDAPRLCGLLIDITERKALEAQLLQAQKMEAVGRLAAGVAHDFNNLLSLIQLQVGELLLEPELQPGMRPGLEQLDTETRRAARLTRQLLTISRKQSFHPTPLDLNEVIRGLTSLLRRLLGEDIRLVMDLDPRPHPVEADGGLLEQVLLNLAVNARDAMAGGGTLTLRSGTVRRAGGAEGRDLLGGDRASPDRVRLSVSDTGTGIPPEVLPRIFEPFFTTKDSERGTGLGLSTVASIVEQHRGNVEVESRPGEGTTFHVLLPAATSEAQPPAALFAASAAAEPPPERPPRGILLVEDQDSLREIVATILGRLGYRVFVAANGVEALEAWQRKKSEIDLLFTDVAMPDGISGYTLARRLLEDRPGLKVLITSGHGFSELETDRPDAIQFLQKPFSAAVLGQTLRDSFDD